MPAVAGDELRRRVTPVGDEMKLLLTALPLLAFPVLAAGDTLLGFDPASSEDQRALEKRLDADLDASDLDRWLQRLSARPHHAGSTASRENAEFIASLFEDWGYEVEIAEYEILLPTPKIREVELVAPTQYTASLTEASLPEDPGTSVREHLLAPYNAFSVDGEVEAELVFVNYGLPDDYEMLERYGIDVAGKIAIAKYGMSWRGIKPKLAAEHGAIGTLIYSDPADDGYAVGDTYPEGPFKHPTGVQRGSVMDMPTYPGDVLTPGVGATADADRLSRDEAPTLTEIPVLPISWKAALPLLEAMDGPVAPDGWRGALPITYHLGPGPARVRLKAEFNWDRVTAYNVIARLEGAHVKFTTIPLGRLDQASIDTAPIIRRVADLFGAERMMWGSDIAQSPGTYAYMATLGREAVSALSAGEQDAVLGGTARRLYGRNWG